MRKNIIITVLLCVIAFLGCYMYATEHMNEDAINNIMEYLPFKEKKSIKRDSSKKHDIKKDKEEAERSDADNKNVPDSVKKKSHAKETITVESYKCKYCGDTIYYIIEDKEYGINGNICWGCYWNRIMEAINEPIEDDVETEDNVEVDNSDTEEDVETEADDNNEDYDDEDYDDGELDEEYYEYENSDDDYEDYDTEDDYDTEEYDDDYDEPSDTYEIENYNEEEE